MLIITVASIILAVCFMVVTYGNPFGERLALHVGDKLLNILKIYAFDTNYAYFFEHPFGISGTIFDNVVYFFDKGNRMTLCASPYYESVFQYDETRDAFQSKCFLSERVIIDEFVNAPDQYYIDVEVSTLTKMIQVIRQSLNKR